MGVGYNESPEAATALAAARTLAAPTNAAIKLLEVIAVPSYAYGGMLAPVGESIDVMLKEAQVPYPRHCPASRETWSSGSPARSSRHSVKASTS